MIVSFLICLQSSLKHKNSVCGFHDYVNISELTNGETERLRYTVVGYTSGILKSLLLPNTYLPKFFIEYVKGSTSYSCPACIEYPANATGTAIVARYNNFQ
jgi:hypothetical protein